MTFHNRAFKWLWVEAVHVLGEGDANGMHEPPMSHLQSVQGGGEERAWEEDPGDHDGEYARTIDSRDAQHLPV